NENVESDRRKMVWYGCDNIPVACGKRVLGHEVEIRRTINEDVVVVVLYLFETCPQEAAISQELLGILLEHLHARIRPCHLPSPKILPNQVDVAGDQVKVWMSYS